MNRNTSAEILPSRAVGILPPVGSRRQAFREIFATAREAFPFIQGLTCIDANRAYFQATGDPTFYSVAITRDEATLLGWTE